jgi:hypothetical protein
MGVYISLFLSVRWIVVSGTAAWRAGHRSIVYFYDAFILFAIFVRVV